MKWFDAIVNHLSQRGIEGELWVNGSFLTEKINPNDVDMVLCLNSSFVDNASTAQRSTLGWFESNLRDSHLCDTYVHIEFPSSDPQYWVGFFMRAYWMKQFGFSRSDQLKGIALVRLS